MGMSWSPRSYRTASFDPAHDVFPRVLTGTLTEPWLDTGLTKIPKLAVAFTLECANIGDGNCVQLTVQYDEGEDDTGWIEVGLVHEADNQTVTFELPRGTLFNDIRWRYSLTRGSTNTETPEVLSCVLSYIRTPRRAVRVPGADCATGDDGAAHHRAAESGANRDCQEPHAGRPGVRQHKLQMSGRLLPYRRERQR